MPSINPFTLVYLLVSDFRELLYYVSNSLNYRLKWMPALLRARNFMLYTCLISFDQ